MLTFAPHYAIHYIIVSGPPDILFEQYFNLFSSKPCCSADLRMYVSLLTEDEQETVSGFSLLSLLCGIVK